jgi:hypothetical protein
MQQEPRQRAAKHALGILRSCGVGSTSEDKSVWQVLDAYLRTHGKNASPPVIAVRELLAEHVETQPAPPLYDWLVQLGRP